MMGSIFAPDAMRDGMPYVVEPAETFAPHRMSAHETAGTTGSHGNDIGTLNHEGNLARGQGDVPQPSAEAGEATRKDGNPLRELPLVSPQFVSESVGWRPTDTGRRSGEIESEPESGVSAARWIGPQTSAETGVPKLRARYEPLVPASQPRLVQNQPPVANVARTAKAEAARRAVPTQREADEIHIHIGRIEVAASASPAPQVVRPATARKALSLDEYLKRGNGRGR